MDRPSLPGADSRRRSLPGAAIALFALALLSGPALASCSAAHGDTSAVGSSAMPTMADAATAPPMGGGQQSADRPPADAGDAWAARPAFVHTSAASEEAYAYALYHPEVVRWMPCYCGCGGMGHRSNLDCYLKEGMPGARTVFEEHASYCQICVDTTLLAKKMYSQGRSLGEIRQAVDRTFGGGAPGTPTDLPPA